MSAWISWPLLLLAAYAVAQLIPLPLAVLDIISPARAGSVRAANAVLPAPVNFATLSLTPGAALEHLIIVAASIVLVFLIRELAWEHRPWKVFAPVIAIALAEALFAIVQAYFLGAGEARGTWANRNHFADFQAMCLPFPAAFGVYVWERWSRRRDGVRPAAFIWLSFSIGLILLLAVTQSLSRMGFTAALLGLTVLALLLTAFNYGELRRSAHSKALALGAIFFAALVAAFLLAPTELISRFGTAEFSDGIRTQDRLLLWKESFALVRAYPLFGAGLGGYESAFLTYKVTFPLVRDAYAHNDYLQYLIELGGLGYALAAMAAAGVLWRAVKMAVRCRGEARIVSAACCGAFAAILLHSTVDFSLYVPANALLLAWVAGVAASVEDRGAQHEVILPARRTVHYETRNHIIPA